MHLFQLNNSLKELRSTPLAFLNTFQNTADLNFCPRDEVSEV